MWGYRALGRTRTLESHASRVRKKLCLDPSDTFVVNVWGVGYRLVDGPVVEGVAASLEHAETIMTQRPSTSRPRVLILRAE